MPSEAEALVAGTKAVTGRQESESSGVFIVSVEGLSDGWLWDEGERN